MKDVRSTPPTFIRKLIEWLGDRRDAEIILGDLQEMYHARLEANGKSYARLAYVADFFTLLFHRAFRKKKKKYPSNSFSMFSNYFKTATRLLLRQKAHNAINITGLSIGLAITLVISLFVSQELSFDRFHEKGNRIYLMPMTWKFAGTAAPVPEATSAAGIVIKDGFPQVETMVRVKEESLILINNGKTFDEKEVLAVDSTFFEVFTFPLVAGNVKEALRQPLSLILTEKTAEKYFGSEWRNESILSKTLEGQNKKLYQITGVAKNPPVNSHIQFDMLMSMTSLPYEKTPNWDYSAFFTYLVLQPGSSPARMVAEFPAVLNTKVGKWASENIELDLMPLNDIYLRNDKYPGMPHSSDIKYIYIFSIIAAMVLIIAIINYMNLSTARSLERAREVGVRKVIGALRIQLIGQFMSESLLIVFFSMVLALGMVKISLPLFNNISGKELLVDFFAHPEWVAYLFTILLVITVLGGFYPAMILSGYKPVSVLKGKLKNSVSGLSLRRLLVVTQFSISILLIICTLMIRNQLTFMSSAKVGFDKEHLVALAMDSLSRGNLSVLRKELVRVAGVESVSGTSQLPVNVGMRSAVAVGDSQDRQLVSVLGTDPEFAKTAGLEFIAGNNFTPTVEDHKRRWEYVINESAMKFFGWTPETAVGKEMKLWGVNGEVKGVVHDFHFAPLHKPIEPLIVSAGPLSAERFDYLLVRLHGSEFAETLLKLEGKWKELNPESPFSFSFLDERYENLYLTESRLSKIMNVFSGFAIMIAILGLFGLASYTIVQRTKELGIRKVMGASLSNLIVMVSGNFIRLVIVSFLLSVPVSWYIMSKWLQEFHYRIDFNWWIVAGAGLSAILMATATVIYHSIEVARVNPAESLRVE